MSHQCGNKFNLNILYQCYSKSKTSYEKLRFKPLRGHLGFDFFKKKRLFCRVGKKQNKNEILKTDNYITHGVWTVVSQLFLKVASVKPPCMSFLWYYWWSQYCNCTSWLNSKILQLSYDMVFQDPANLFLGMDLMWKWKLFFLQKQLQEPGSLSQKTLSYKHTWVAVVCKI